MIPYCFIFALCQALVIPCMCARNRAEFMRRNKKKRNWKQENRRIQLVSKTFKLNIFEITPFTLDFQLKMSLKVYIHRIVQISCLQQHNIGYMKTSSWICEKNYSNGFCDNDPGHVTKGKLVSSIHLRNFLLC